MFLLICRSSISLKLCSEHLFEVGRRKKKSWKDLYRQFGLHCFSKFCSEDFITSIFQPSLSLPSACRFVKGLLLYETFPIVIYLLAFVSFVPFHKYDNPCRLPSTLQCSVRISWTLCTNWYAKYLYQIRYILVSIFWRSVFQPSYRKQEKQHHLN